MIGEFSHWIVEFRHPWIPFVMGEGLKKGQIAVTFLLWCYMDSGWWFVCLTVTDTTLILRNDSSVWLCYRYHMDTGWCVTGATEILGDDSLFWLCYRYNRDTGGWSMCLTVLQVPHGYIVMICLSDCVTGSKWILGDDLSVWLLQVPRGYWVMMMHWLIQEHRPLMGDVHPVLPVHSSITPHHPDQ